MKYCPNCGKESAVITVLLEEEEYLNLYHEDGSPDGTGTNYLYGLTENFCDSALGGCDTLFYLGLKGE